MTMQPSHRSASLWWRDQRSRSWMLSFLPMSGCTSSEKGSAFCVLALCTPVGIGPPPPLLLLLRGALRLLCCQLDAHYRPPGGAVRSLRVRHRLLLLLLGPLGWGHGRLLRRCCSTDWLPRLLLLLLLHGLVCWARAPCQR